MMVCEVDKNNWKVVRGDIFMKCDLCGKEVPNKRIKHIHIKNNVKNICEGCVTAVKGFA